MNKLILLSLLFFFFQVKPNFYDKHQAVKLYESKDYDGAAKKFEKILLKDPADLENIVNMASALYQKGQFKDAANYFKKVLDNKKVLNKKQLEDITFNLGSAFASDEKWQAALQSFEDVLKINSKNERAEKNIEIIKKILAKQKQQQEQDQKSKSDNEQKKDKSGESKDQSQASNRDKDKKDSEKQKDKQKGKQDGAQSQDQSTQQDSKGKGSNKPDDTNKGKQGDASEQGLGNKQHKKDSSSSNSNKKDKQDSVKKQARASQQNAAEDKLNWQELRYLEALDKSDQQANAQMMKARAKKLKGRGGSNANNW